MSKDLYEIGYHVDREEGKAGWPYCVWYFPDAETPFLIGEGVECGSGSMELSAAGILDPKWRTRLEVTSCLWLLPLARRMADGEEVSTDEILDACAEQNGKRPVLNKIQQLRR